MASEDPASDSPDNIFNDPRDRIDDFTFGEETARVFDDMLDRSVPFYAEMQRMAGDLAQDFAVEGTSIWDLGSSTCNTLLELGRRLEHVRDLRFVGVDNSEEMLKRGRRKLMDAGFAHQYELVYGDLNDDVHIDNASIVTLILTLQFVRPLNRENVLRRVFEGLNPNGCLILIEKVLGEDTLFNRLFIKHYYEFKRRQGYSEMEIAQKREALENVLVPYRLTENEALLRRVGFSGVDVFFKWYNFVAIVAKK